MSDSCCEDCGEFSCSDDNLSESGSSDQNSDDHRPRRRKRSWLNYDEYSENSERSENGTSGSESDKSKHHRRKNRARRVKRSSESESETEPSSESHRKHESSRNSKDGSSGSESETKHRSRAYKSRRKNTSRSAEHSPESHQRNNKSRRKKISVSDGELEKINVSKVNIDDDDANIDKEDMKKNVMALKTANAILNKEEEKDDDEQPPLGRSLHDGHHRKHRHHHRSRSKSHHRHRSRSKSHHRHRSRSKSHHRHRSRSKSHHRHRSRSKSHDRHKQYLGDPKDPAYTSRTYHGMRMSKIAMPTGKVFDITVPVKSSSGWQCKKAKSERIELKKHGKVSRREWMIVTKEVEKTKVAQRVGNFSKFEFIKVEKLVNSCLWKRYRYRRRDIMAEIAKQTGTTTGNPNDRMLFHGSPHVLELADTGFDERYASAAGMFGAGLYFAENSSKSNLYVFGITNGNKCPTHQDDNCDKCVRHLLLCRVTLGIVKEHTTAFNYAHPPVGFNSVMGVKGGTLLTNEYVVYRGEQIYPEYLITYKIVK